jgi:recombinational DNA repair ATPase RecF
LLDDIMGELDAKRRNGLLPLLERAHHAQGQVFMTSTTENWPSELARDAHRWTVRQGAVQAK